MAWIDLADPLSQPPVEDEEKFLEVGGLTYPTVIEEWVTKPHAAIIRRAWLTHLLEAQDHRCTYCQRIVSMGPDDPDLRATFDHVEPLSLGGKDALSNGAAACRFCNSIKGSGTFEELEVNPKYRMMLMNCER